ncbi:MAG: hypothetical protein RLZZ316_1522 [Bacteroidota bacterium]|jgi:hypothetical protein
MAERKPLSTNMRIWHRYLGYFLAGIMAVYAVSGIIMIFRDTDFLKKEQKITKMVKPNAEPGDLGPLLKMRTEVVKTEGNIIYLKNGTYDKSTGKAELTIKELPFLLHKMEDMHKATSKKPLFFLNIFFGVSLLFFVVSSFWMFLPKTTIFKKGLYFTIAGILLTLIVLFVGN